MSDDQQQPQKTAEEGDVQSNAAMDTTEEVSSVIANTVGNVAEEQQPQGAPPAPPPSRMESFMAVTKSLVVRALIIYFITSFFRRPQSAPQNDVQTTNAPKLAAWNYFEDGTLFDLHVYLSDNFDRVRFDAPGSLIWLQEGLVYGDWTRGPTSDGIYTQTIRFKTPSYLMRNGSIYLHAFVTKSGRSPNPAKDKLYAGEFIGHTRKMLSKYKRIRSTKNYNLLTGEVPTTATAKAELEKLNELIVPHWHPNLTINIVTDQTNWVKGSIPQPMDEYVQFVQNGKIYLPIVFLNDYWNMLRDYMPINETTPELELHLCFQPLTTFKWQLYAAQAMKHKWNNNMFGELMLSGQSDETDDDQDSLKEILLETNPYLLGLTIVVSLLHSIFELLAFKNDIQFWNNRKSLEGLSVRSVFFTVFQSLIVLLYVLDNETNIMIRVSCFIGLGIEIWKIQKVVDISFDRSRKLFGVIPRIQFKDKGSYVDSSTKQYDNLAFKYLGWVCFPLLFGYSIYSLIYKDHKGWYSFVLNMLYGYLLTFGFIMMTPQLFINYKLKSVAHLPWRMMTYKFFNTFIDDVFAFVIKMPTMYRLGCFRDDIVFFIFLYQRWIYKVDHKRVNEFGFSGDMEEEAKLAVSNNQNSVDKSSAQAAPEIANNAVEKSPEAKKRE